MKLTKIIMVSAMLFTTYCSNVFAQTVFYEVEKLFDAKKFSAFLAAIDPVLPQINGAERLTKAYYMRGCSRFNVVYQGRTGCVFGSNDIFDEKRPRFELEYKDKITEILDGAISDLKQALEIGSAEVLADKDNSGLAYRFKSIELDIRQIAALIYLEKAQFITNSDADFLLAESAFVYELEPLYVTFAKSTSFDNFDSDNIRLKTNALIAAEIRSRVAMGKIDNSFSLFTSWIKVKGLPVKDEIAIATMVEAFDMVGNYKYTEAFLIREAIRQITMDKGKVVPQNFSPLKAAMKSHLANMNFAVAIPADGKLLSLQRARLSSAYNIKGNLSATESTFIKNAPDAIKADKNTPPADVQLNSLMLKLQSTDKKESNAANKMLEDMLKKDGTNAAILAVSGYAKMLNQDFAGAETNLSAALKKDAFLAFAYGAFQNRALVYTKLGKADAATKDEQENSRFKQLLAFMAAG